MARFCRLILLCCAAMVLVSFDLAPAGPPPPTPADTVFDTLHGVVIPDPYRWLEDGDDPTVQEWTKEQYAYFKDYVDSFPGREALEGEVRRLMEIGSVGSPEPYGEFYFWTERHAGQDHPVVYMKKGISGEPGVLLDPNTLSDDNTVALDWYFFSPTGELMVYGLSNSGSELSTLYLMNTQTRELYPDTIPHTRAAAISWLADESGFYYTRFAEPGSVPDGDENYYRRVYRHTLGEDWRNDPLVFGEQIDKTAWPWISWSPDRTRIFFGSYVGSQETDLYLESPDGARLLNEGEKAYFSVTPANDCFFIHTNFEAPAYRVMRAEYDKPMLQDWTEIIPESDKAIQSVQLIAGRLVLHSYLSASSVVDIYSHDGTFEKTIELPSIGSVSSINGQPDGQEMFFLFQSFNYPPTVFRYDFSDGSLSEYDRLDVDIDLSNIEVKLVWYESQDGTRVSMFLVGPEGLSLNGSNPTLLYGYGGFNSSQIPYFSKTLTLWFKRGGLFAYPHLRGGGEYGEAWHRAGMLERKQNTFDDFIAAAEYLCREGYTSPDLLTIEGGSNGGLLIGAVITQRPDICRSAICAVPLLDMLRYHRFLIARFWIPEYGSADDSAQFQFLYQYSPYHRIEPGTHYPTLLLTAAESDSRVDPLHARKFAARLQATDPEAPILLRIESRAGHGQGKPISKQIEETVDEWVFVFKSLGLSLDVSN
ncbi:prolyl oligopeptidase family serine peptidase [bacterium]|nr:prolyl oligopeptidase family serine peptidase [bacterium]